MNKSNYDKKTLALIKSLIKIKKNEPKKFTDVDGEYLQKLLNKEIDYNQIEAEKKKCKNDIEYYIDNYIQVKNKFENPDTIPEILRNRVVNDRIKFVMYDIQRQLVQSIINDDKVISVKSRQIGFTTTTLACASQLITFQNNKTVLLFSKSEKDAKATLEEMIFMIDNLPFFLRRNKHKQNAKELALGNSMNASKIVAQTSGKSSGRSHSATWLITDEAEFVTNIEEIYKAALFTISATKGKIMVLSTPNIHGSQFHNMVIGAKNKSNGFTLIEGEWQSIPQRNQDWYDEQCKLLNYDKNAIKTELDMKQILPYETYFSEKKLMAIKGLEPVSIFGAVDQYEKPISNKEYIIAVDCQEEGSHYNAISVLSMDTKKIVATQRTRMSLFDTLLELSKEYNNAKIMIERNRGFYLIKKFEENDLQHLLLPNIKYIMKTDSYDFDIDKDGNVNKYGFVTLKNTRTKVLLQLSDYIYRNKELPKTLIQEASTFVIKNGKAIGLDNDDLLMATGIGLLTIAVIEQAKIKAKNDRKMKYLLNSYQGKSILKKTTISRNEQNKNIKKTIKSFHRAMVGYASSQDIDNHLLYNQLSDNDIDNIDSKKIVPLQSHLSKALMYA